MISLQSKITFGVSICTLILGYTVGRYTANKISKTTTITHSETTQVQKSDIVQQATVQKDSTTSQQMHYVEKSFNSKGILIHEIDYGQNQGASNRMEVSTQTHKVKVDAATSISNNTTIVNYESNWLAGAYVPVTLDLDKMKNPKNLEFTLGYRVFSGVYLTTTTNYNFSPVFAGILIHF